MKKKLLMVLPLLMLMGCANVNVNNVPSAPIVEEEEEFVPYVTEVNGLPTIVTTRDLQTTTYLMLSKYGVIDGHIKGKVADKFYEETVAFVAKIGDPLPIPTSTVEGATFRGWAYYGDNENVWPDYYTTVPAQEGLALKAIFDGTKTSGGGSGGGQPAQSGFGIKFTNGNVSLGTASGKDSAGRDQYKITGQAFVTGDEFSLYDASSGGTWAIDLDGYSLGGTAANQDAWKAYLSKGETSYTVLQDFTADLYIKLSMTAGDQLYVELKS